jgi:hypothetical protein
VVSRSGPVARLLELGPLRYIGRISYGVYLWHFPLFIWIDHQRTGLDGYALLTARVVATLAVSSASYRLVELPIMRGAAFRKKIAWLAASGAAGALTVVTVMFTATTATALVPATMPSAGATNAPDAGRTRVLIVGDSTAVTLSLGLSTTPDRYGVTEDSFTFLGCGVADGTEVFEHGVVFQVAAQCNLLTPASDQWPALWATRFNTFHPNVVAMLAGRWEVEDRLYDGRWTNILDRRFAAYVEQQLNLAAWIVRSAGARFVLFTAPYYSSGEQPDGSAWPEDDPRRVDAYNRILYQVAAADPEFVSVVDLKRLVCPGGKFVTSVDGVIVRAPDGIHLPYFSRSDPNDPSPDTYAQVRQFSAWIEPKLWPLITREEPLASRTSGPIRGTQRRRS